MVGAQTVMAASTRCAHQCGLPSPLSSWFSVQTAHSGRAASRIRQGAGATAWGVRLACSGTHRSFLNGFARVFLAAVFPECDPESSKAPEPARAPGAKLLYHLHLPQLPLQVSNLDSPDPESGVLPVTPRGSLSLRILTKQCTEFSGLPPFVQLPGFLSYTPG